jgi:hypothetical protein
MTPRPTARLIGYFAHKAPVCVIVRRGPTSHTQLILWQTDTDQFTPGQWLKKGVVSHASLSSDAKFMSMALMGGKSRIGSWEDTQIGILCRPPYFSAIETTIDPSGFTPRPCLPEEKFDDSWTFQEGHIEGVDQSGRKVRFEEGRVFVQRNGNWEMIFDTNPLTFEPIAPPDWAIAPLKSNP